MARADQPPRAADQGSGATAAGGRIDYDPNQLVTLESSVPIPAMWGGNGVATSNMKVCQEVTRQAVNAALQRNIAVTNTVGPNIQELRRSDTSARVEVPPPAGVTPPITAVSPGAEDVGVPTQLEEKIAEELGHAVDKLRSVLEDLDVTITVTNSENGKEIRVRSAKGSSGVPTSEDEIHPAQVMPGTKVDVAARALTRSSGDGVRLVTESGGEPLTILAVSDSGQPTVGEGSSASVSTQAKNDFEQIGFVNTSVLLQVAVNIGPIINVQL